MKTYVTILITLVCVFSACTEELYDESKTPEETIATFELAEGFYAEVFASEPFVKDPVEMIFDGQGRLYAVEMPDYPYMPEPGKGVGRIVQLFDRNGDGKIDDSAVFADAITEATSILPWKDGLLVAAAPNILFIKDVDGDGKAEQKEVLFTGFFENNSEAQVTNLTYGVDNWIYASNHGQAGKVRFVKDPDAKELSVGGGDFRFRLDDNRYESVSGTAQFGQAFNDEWQRFVTQNTLHIQHAVIPHRYLERHPYLSSTNTMVNVSDHDLEMFQRTPPPYWRAERTRRRQIQYKEQNLDRMEYAEDHFTGSSGGTFYDGSAFPQAFYGSIFTGDVSGNLVHRDVVEQLPMSPTFVARRAQSEIKEEFLSSTDSWFRPASFTVGPDGFLYVVDMYRQHIETPLSIPEDLKEDMDFMKGSDRGRIYRIIPDGSTSTNQEFPDFRGLNSGELVEMFTSDSRWHRLTAQRLLIEKQDVSVSDALVDMFQSSDSKFARLHAFYTLSGLKILDNQLINKAMMDPYAGIRKHGISMAEEEKLFLSNVLNGTKDEDVQVAFQACLSLGSFDDQEAKNGLVEVLSKNYKDKWFRKAVLSSFMATETSFMEALIFNGFFDSLDANNREIARELGSIIGQQKEKIGTFLNLLVADDGSEKTSVTADALLGILQGIDRAGVSLKVDAILKAFMEKISHEDSNTKLIDAVKKLDLN